MYIPQEMQEPGKRILDLGGWFITEPRATHVVDLMPWETRGAKLQLQSQPDEKFSAETWTQLDFLDPKLQLPFEDDWFDYVTCGHTIEDLKNPLPLIKEMQRVGKAGVIECPSRLTEQTIGMRDRMCRLAGHPHHHWIVSAREDTLELHAKADSQLDRSDTLIPLVHTERLIQRDAEQYRVTFQWHDTIPLSVNREASCEIAAREFVSASGVARIDRWTDSALRAARRIRARFKATPVSDANWWAEMLELSRPYSKISRS